MTFEDTTQAMASRKPIGLALQGGGSWGAYTWGVLDAVLSSRSVSIAHLSGTSAGAINAAIVAGALAKGSVAQARKSLRSFWLSIARPAVADLGREVWGPMERVWRDSLATWLVSSGSVSPYHVNPLNINPLRDAIAEHVDFDAIRSKEAPALYVTGDQRQDRPASRHRQRRHDPRRAARVGVFADGVPGSRNRRRSLLGRWLLRQSDPVADDLHRGGA